MGCGIPSARKIQLIGRSFEAEEVKLEAEQLAPGRSKWTARIGDRELELGQVTPKPQERTRATKELMHNLASAIEQTERHGARIILMTYPSREGLYAASNKLTRAVAQRTGTTLIDLAKTFGEACPDVECAELLLEDQHPRAEGYVLAAETIARELTEETPR